MCSNNSIALHQGTELCQATIVHLGPKLGAATGIFRVEVWHVQLNIILMELGQEAKLQELWLGWKSVSNAKPKKRLDVFYSNFDIVERSSKAAFCLYKGCSLTSTNILWFQSDVIWINEWMWVIRYSQEICFEMWRGGEAKTLEGHKWSLNPFYIRDIYLEYLFRIFIWYSLKRFALKWEEEENAKLLGSKRHAWSLNPLCCKL